MEPPEQRRQEMDECYAYFAKLWNERVNAPPRNDLMSMMAHSDATRQMDPDNLMGNIILLIVGGNDTTRNTMSGSVLALNEHPEQYQKLRDNPELIDTMVPEVIRWQTPLAHGAAPLWLDTEIGGKNIRKGERVVMWYVSGNRDEEGIEQPEEFIIDRARPRTHLSFGFGIHRCVGMRLAELQLKIVWQEMLKRLSASKWSASRSGSIPALCAASSSCRSAFPDEGGRPRIRLKLAEAIMDLPRAFPARRASASSPSSPGNDEMALAKRRGDALQFFGHFHGGIISALADHAAGDCQPLLALPEGKIAVTRRRSQITFCSPADGKELIARAKTLKMSALDWCGYRSRSVSRREKSETLCAFGTATMRAMDLPGELL